MARKSRFLAEVRSRSEQRPGHEGEAVRVAVYARVSTSDQSCELQLHALRQYASRQPSVLAPGELPLRETGLSRSGYVLSVSGSGG